MTTILETNRLILRHWKEEDIIPFANMNADPIVMQYFQSTLSKDESHQLAEKLQNEIILRDIGFWALELKATKEFIGFTGLRHTDINTHFTPCIEIGWRLAKEFWGKGLAYEAAFNSLMYGFKKLQLEEIVSYTPTQNFRSCNLMKKLNMKSDPKEHFAHPLLSNNHPLKKHILYRIKKLDFTL